LAQDFRIFPVIFEAMKRSYWLLILILGACKGYKDPAPFTDPRIVTPYCNTPSAINYNWNFPGIPDESVCVYPAEIYSGTYFYRDSIKNSSGLLLSQDSFYLHFTQIDTVRLKIEGFCTGKEFTAHANRYFKFTIDSVAGNGQLLCNGTDTLMGIGTKTDLWDSLQIRLNYEVHSDTAIYYHNGTAIKQ